MFQVSFITSFLVSLLSAIFILLILYGLTAAGYWLIFTKAGQPYWSALIPIYNIYTQYKIAWDVFWFWAYIGGLVLYMILHGHGWFLNMFSYLPFMVSFGISLTSSVKLAKSFGKSAAYGVGLYLLGPVFLLLLGLGNSHYLGPQP